MTDPPTVDFFRGSYDTTPAQSSVNGDEHQL